MDEIGNAEKSGISNFDKAQLEMPVQLRNGTFLAQIDGTKSSQVAKEFGLKLTVKRKVILFV